MFAIDASRLSVSHCCARSVTLTELVDVCAGLGLAGVAVTENPAPGLDSPAAIRAMIESRGLRCSSVNSAGYFVSGKDNGALIALAAELKAPLNVIDGGLSAANPLGLVSQRREMLGVELGKLAGVADPAGAKLSVEPIHPSGSVGKGVVNTLAELARHLDDHPSLGVTLDLYHSWWDPDLAGFIADRVQRIRVVQVCGLHIGEGNVVERAADPEIGKEPLQSFVGLLERAGYTGLYEIEYFHDDDAGQVRKWIAKWTG